MSSMVFAWVVLVCVLPLTATAEPKPLPRGVFRSIGGLRSPTDDPWVSVRLTAAVDGIEVGVAWDLCGDDRACLFDAIGRVLDGAAQRGVGVALAVSDGDSVPPAVEAGCASVAFEFRGTPRRMCLAWDPTYLAAKLDLVAALGEAFDTHPGLAYVYFTGACSTNGNEGHCRIDQGAYTRAAYTPERLAGAYATILAAYQQAFPRTPIAIEVHALFDSAYVWDHLWQQVRGSGRVGLAAWWCSERLSVRGQDTVPVWPLVQDAATQSFSVCQTVGSFVSEPDRFTDGTLGLDYGDAGRHHADDTTRAFRDTLDWAEGRAVHAGQESAIARFGVLEAWSQDADFAAFQERLAGF